MVYSEAQKRRWPTTGFACSKAANFKCFPCDNVFIIGLLFFLKKILMILFINNLFINILFIKRIKK